MFAHFRLVDILIISDWEDQGILFKMFVRNSLVDILIVLDWEDQGVLLQHSAEAEQAEHDIEWDHKVPGSGPLQKPAARYESMK